MRKFLFFSALFFMSSFVSLAESNTSVKNDTTLEISPVTIVSNKPADLTNVSRVGIQTIENRYEPSVLSLLSEEVPGLFTTQRGVMGYGVAGCWPSVIL
jgi:hypothetical protein